MSINYVLPRNNPDFEEIKKIGLTLLKLGDSLSGVGDTIQEEATGTINDATAPPKAAEPTKQVSELLHLIATETSVVISLLNDMQGDIISLDCSNDQAFQRIWCLKNQLAKIGWMADEANKKVGGPLSPGGAESWFEGVEDLISSAEVTHA